MTDKNFLGILVLIFCVLLYNISLITSQAVFPTKSEQVNLLTNVHELFEEIKHSANAEQMVMDESMKIDLELMMKRARFTTEIMRELTLLKLTTRSNAVCALDAREEIENTLNQAFCRLKECVMTGQEDLCKHFSNLTNITESAINHGEEFLDKLDACSEKRGLAVIACYRKIIQEDVVPVKTILSDALKHHGREHLKAFKIKEAVSLCVDSTIEDLNNELERVLDKGLKCI